MDPTPPSLLASTLGQRMRQARRQRGLTQDAIAQPEFTKSYVSAVERDKARPSLKALELMARRLGVPMTELLSPPAAAPTDDLPVLAATVTYQLDDAARAIATHRPQDALALLTTAEQQAGPALADLPIAIRFRLAYLRATAYVAANAPDAARVTLAAATDLAHQVDAGEARERVRHLVGQTYYAQDLPQAALEQHLGCREAIQRGVVRDPQFQLQIYACLVEDYGALGATARVVAICQEAQALLAGAGNLATQADLYWNLSRAAQAAGGEEQAQQWVRRALDLAEAADTQSTAAQLEINVARAYIQQAEYAEAEAALARARALVAGAGNAAGGLSTIQQCYADLELHRGQIAAAADCARTALALSEQAYQAAVHAEPSPARTRARDTYIQALGLAGRVAGAQDDLASAERWFTQALDLAQIAGGGAQVAELAHTYAEILLAHGQHEQASAYYQQAWRPRSRPPSF
jgi:transcriptional regulator with XRE-family HTH domain